MTNDDLKSGIYKILNTITGKFYIGSASNIQFRWNYHKSYLRLGTHYNKHLQSAWNKYWEVNFQFIILEKVEKEKLIEREQFWLDLTRCYDRELGYNSRPIADNNLGKKFVWTKEQIVKRGLAQRGKIISLETRQKLSALNKGKKLSEETKRKVSEAGKGRKFTDKSKAKIGLANSNKEKWHNGYKCNCRECLDKKNFIRKSQQRISKNEIYNILNNSKIIELTI